MSKSTVERFLEKVSTDSLNGCWLWTGCRIHNGYGQLWDGSKVVYAHRFAYELWVGPIPEGMQLDHYRMNEDQESCSRACVSPDHLEVVSHQENLRRSSRHRENGRRIGLASRKHDLPEGVMHHRKRFRARIWIDGTLKHLGIFDSAEEASKAYRLARKRED